jgi:glucosylceramidase
MLSPNHQKQKFSPMTIRDICVSLRGLFIICISLCFANISSAQAQPSLRWVSSTRAEPWKELSATVLSQAPASGPNVLKLDPQIVHQTIDGFGGCFNELGWDALQSLDGEQQVVALKALFDASGCNFNLCRAPMGANDFARDWYSFDETPGDYAMTNFSIARDQGILIPFIKAAMRYQPQLAVWGVPWSPPAWMKTSGSYKGGNLKQDPQTLAAYALYFSKYVRAYRAEGINLYAVHPQNEPKYNNNVYPQCAWNGNEIDAFLRDYLVPQLKQDHVDVQVWMGTIVNPNLADYIDPVLGDAATRPAISGVGYQWGGQDALLATHQKYPEQKLMQTETECNNGADSWSEGMTTFRKMIEDLNHFANGYVYWNLVLNEKSTSTWGWKQNSLLKIDSQSNKISYNPEFYSMKHFGHFVQHGAVRIGASALMQIGGEENIFTTSDVVAFRNPSGEVVVIFSNDSDKILPITLQSGNHAAKLELPAQSMNSFVLSGW